MKKLPSLKENQLKTSIYDVKKKKQNKRRQEDRLRIWLNSWSEKKRKSKNEKGNNMKNICLIYSRKNKN